MRKFTFAVFIFFLTQNGALSQTAGDAAAGKVLWDSEDLRCKECHGDAAEGGFGPVLAGRGLKVEQVNRAVRQPAGIMPAFVVGQVSDEDIANITAYFSSLPKVSMPGPWQTPVPSNAAAGQRIAISVGCGQCHGAALPGLRSYLGAVDGDLNVLKGLVYTHTTMIGPFRRSLGGNAPSPLRMGNFNPDRVTEGELQQILDWMKTDVGYRAAMRGRISKGVLSDKGVTYTVNAENFGLAGKGLTAEDVSIQVRLPAGTSVVETTGAGFKGVRTDEKTKAQIAEWSWPKAGPSEKMSYTITLSKAGTKNDNVRGQIVWERPLLKPRMTADQAEIPGAPL